MPKPIAQRCRQTTRPRRRTDDRKPRQVQPDGARRRSLADDDIQLEILHRRIQNLLHRPAEAMNFIDEQNIAVRQISQNRRQIARFLNRRAAGHTQICAHFISNHRRHGRLAKPRRAVQQHMVKRLAALFGSSNRQFQILFQPLLPDVFRKTLRTQTYLNPLLLGVVVM